jgi:hypothetical protein
LIPVPPDRCKPGTRSLHFDRKIPALFSRESD